MDKLWKKEDIVKSLKGAELPKEIDFDEHAGYVMLTLEFPLIHYDDGHWWLLFKTEEELIKKLENGKYLFEDTYMCTLEPIFRAEFKAILDEIRNTIDKDSEINYDWDYYENSPIATIWAECPNFDNAVTITQRLVKYINSKK